MLDGLSSSDGRMGEASTSSSLPPPIRDYSQLTALVWVLALVNLKLLDTTSKPCGESCCRGQERFIRIVGESGTCGKVAETHLSGINETVYILAEIILAKCYYTK